MDPDTRLRGDLKNAMERLCRSQVAVDEPHRTMLQEAINNIRQVAAFHCPDWSKYDLPTTALDDM